MNAPRHTSARAVAAPATAATAFALLLGACGGGEPTVETSTVELETDPAAVPADPAAPAAPEADVAAATDDATDDALAAGSEAVDAAAAGAEETWTSLQANWEESVDEVQAHFGELSEQDVLATGGDRDALVAVVQERYRLEPEEAERQVADWEATL